MSLRIFADIDDNLVTTCREQPEASARAVGWHEGKPVAWLTEKQEEFLNVLKAMGEIVPTTARSSAGFHKLALNWNPEYAIVSFGGAILTKSGAPEPRWHELMQAEATRYKSQLARLRSIVIKEAAASNIDVRIRIVNDWDLDLFLGVKHNQRDLAQLSLLKDVLHAAMPTNWQLSFNGNALSALPPYLGKEKAVAWFKNNIAQPDELTIGFGDSHSDIGFMGNCDYLMMPSGSQNHELLAKAERTAKISQPS